MHRIFVVVVCNRLCSRLSASSPHKKVFFLLAGRENLVPKVALFCPLSLSSPFCFAWGDLDGNTEGRRRRRKRCRLEINMFAERSGSSFFGLAWESTVQIKFSWKFHENGKL